MFARFYQMLKLQRNRSKHQFTQKQKYAKDTLLKKYMKVPTTGSCFPQNRARIPQTQVSQFKPKTKKSIELSQILKSQLDTTKHWSWHFLNTDHFLKKLSPKNIDHKWITISWLRKSQPQSVSKFIVTYFLVRRMPKMQPSLPKYVTQDDVDSCDFSTPINRNIWDFLTYLKVRQKYGCVFSKTWPTLLYFWSISPKIYESSSWLSHFWSTQVRS